jgi:hypothetical protein
MDQNQSAAGYAGYGTDPQLNQMSEYGKFLQEQKPTQPIQSWTQVASQMLNSGLGGYERSRAAQLMKDRSAQLGQDRITQMQSPQGAASMPPPVMARPPDMAPNASGFPPPGSPQSAPSPVMAPSIAGTNQNVSGVNAGGNPMAPFQRGSPVPGIGVAGPNGQNMMAGMFPQYGGM